MPLLFLQCVSPNNRGRSDSSGPPTGCVGYQDRRVVAWLLARVMTRKHRDEVCHRWIIQPVRLDQFAMFQIRPVRHQAAISSTFQLVQSWPRSNRISQPSRASSVRRRRQQLLDFPAKIMLGRARQIASAGAGQHQPEQRQEGEERNSRPEQDDAPIAIEANFWILREILPALASEATESPGRVFDMNPRGKPREPRLRHGHSPSTP